MENPSTTTPTYTPVHTVQKGCMRVDGRALLMVRSGSRIEDVLEQSLLLMDCMHALILDREPRGKHIQTTTLQFLNDLSRSMISACYEGVCAQEGAPQS